MKKRKISAVRWLGFVGILVVGVAMVCLIGGCGAINEVNDYYYPNWLPDGRIICSKIYTKSKDIGLGTWERVEQKYYVAVMDDAGNNEQDLFEVASSVKEITCSPTGELIAYITKADGTITVSNYSGSSQTTLLGIASAEYVDWSPDATQLVYSNSDNALHVVNRDGTGNTQIATSAAVVAWRVGDLIAYDGDWVNIISSSGEGKVVLTDYSWKPQKVNSNTIYYEGKDGVYSINTDGTSNTKLFSDYEQVTLKLSFDNTKIVGGDFDQTGIKDIWVINVDGTNSEQLR